MDYPFGRLAIQILRVIFLLMLIAGVVIAFAGVGGSLYELMRQEFGIALPLSFFGSLTGVAIALFAMVALAFLDHIAATIDTAGWTRKNVKVSEQQLAISKEILRITKKTLEVQHPQIALQHEQEDKSGKRRGLLGMLSRSRNEPASAEGAERREPAFASVDDPKDDGNRQLAGNSRSAVGIASSDGSDITPLQHPIDTKAAEVSTLTTGKE